MNALHGRQQERDSSLRYIIGAWKRRCQRGCLKAINHKAMCSRLPRRRDINAAATVSLSLTDMHTIALCSPKLRLVCLTK